MTISEIAADELATLSDVRIVDVREDDEWIESHLAAAVHVPLGDVPDHLDAFGEDGAADPTYVICKVGGRSQRACEYAAGHGKHVVNVAGGMMAWTMGGHATVSGH